MLARALAASAPGPLGSAAVWGLVGVLEFRIQGIPQRSLGFGRVGSPTRLIKDYWGLTGSIGVWFGLIGSLPRP